MKLETQTDQLWSLNGLEVMISWTQTISRFSKFEEIKCFRNIEDGTTQCRAHWISQPRVQSIARVQSALQSPALTETRESGTTNQTKWRAMPMKCTKLYMCVRLNSRMRARQSMIRRRKCRYYSVHISRQLSCPAGYLSSNFPNRGLTCSQFIVSSDIYCRSLNTLTKLSYTV